jgi:ribonuclease HII
MNDSLFLFDRGQGARYVCGADEAGRACRAGPLVAAAVRFDYARLDADPPNLVDGFELKDVGLSPRPVERGDQTSAAIAAASIFAKETRDWLMGGLDVELPRLRVRGA